MLAGNGRNPVAGYSHVTFATSFRSVDWYHYDRKLRTEVLP